MNTAFLTTWAQAASLGSASVITITGTAVAATKTFQRITHNRRPHFSVITNDAAPAREISEVMDRWDRGVLKEEFTLVHTRAERKADQHREDLGRSLSWELRP